MVKAKTDEKTEEVKRLPFAKEEKIISATAKALLESLTITAPFEVKEMEDSYQYINDGMN